MGIGFLGSFPAERVGSAVLSFCRSAVRLPKKPIPLYSTYIGELAFWAVFQQNVSILPFCCSAGKLPKPQHNQQPKTI